MSSQINREASSGSSSYSSDLSSSTKSGKGDKYPHLDQLTKLLWMHPDVNLANPRKPWLNKQEARVRKLDESLQRPKDIMNRLAARIDKHHHPTKSARLCPSHRGLNPRVIRSLMLILATEFTQRTDRFRKWRTRTPLSDSLVAWIDRMDSATSLWIGCDSFHFVFGYECPIQDIPSVDSQCEACIMAVVGGRPLLLSDLRASMVARESQYPRTGRTRPRLWSLVDSWISHFDADVRTAIRQRSNDLGAEIVALDNDKRRQKKESAKARIESGKPPKTRHRRHSKKPGKLPEPVQPDSRRWSQYSEYAGHTFMEDKSPVQEDEDCAPMLRAEPRVNPVGGNHFEKKHARDDDEDNAMGSENWNWLLSRMEEQGVAPHENYQAMRGIHPALGEYGFAAPVPVSATVPVSAPVPVSVPVPVSANVGSELSRRSSWTTMTVQTEVDEFQMEAKAARPRSSAESEDMNAATLPQEQFVPARAHWGKMGFTNQQEQQQEEEEEEEEEDEEEEEEEEEQEQRFSRSSSMYSSHSGFRQGFEGSLISQDQFAYGGWRPAYAPSSTKPPGTGPGFDWEAENAKYPEWI
ncbi:hypothetical protein AK830_g10515 [Neonectria ditissima]|uniref:Uncharacterized protein n=1 Tax=Neonectria ditissima TaxID=78410 RepID=A0A0P7B6L4_9HYPO|nr:hypothetical protein AK830_g10515 [Neonectria ditissima]